MHAKSEVQLTIRGVPAHVKKILLQRAGAERRSLNALLVEVLTAAAAINDQGPRYFDLDELAGTWVSDPEFDSALEAQHRIDLERM